ncbi:capsid staple protein, partial [Escherichia coli]
MKTGTDSFVGEDGKPETKDQYPWGLRITLDNESLQRLGLNAKSLPAVGDSISVKAMANVCSVSTRTTDHGEDNYVELQITDIGVAP